MTVPLIVQAWRDPDVLLSLSEPAWEELVAQGRRTQLLARLAARVAAAGMLPRLPHGPRRALGSELRVAVHESDVVRWETMCLERALASACSELILLKGAAYLLTDLSIAKGRISSDVDVLVPSGDLPAAEAALLANGWVHVKLEPYDQLYYRQWTHELPPLQHAERETFVDVHHAILPITSRLQPDVGRLRAAARPVGDGSRWKVLSPAHMVVHSAVHGFHDGEMVNPLGDILDIHQLVSEFTTRDSSFPNHLIEEGRRMGVQVPLGHALRAATRWFGPMAPGFPEPGSLPSSARIVDACIDAMVRRSVVPPRELGRSGAGLAMYMRSHWLKMPPLLLARHLTVKLLARRKEGARPDLVGRA